MIFSFKVVNSFKRDLLQFFEKQVLLKWAPSQKKIICLALAILSYLVIIAFYRSYKSYSIKSVKTLSKLQETENVAQIKQDFKTKLERNRQFARNQQSIESAKHFALVKEEIPQIISMFTPSCGSITQPLYGIQLVVNGREVGISHCQGARKTMEDAQIASEGYVYINTQPILFEVFGIFDGHGGAEASNYVKKHIVAYLTTQFEYFNHEQINEEGIYYALKATFEKLHQDYENLTDGTTATVAVIIEDKIWVANVGDSRTIFVKNGMSIQATEDAKPHIWRYEKKIKKLGGEVLGNRVNGSLAVANAIGDKDVKGKKGKCCVSADPQITYYSLADFLGGHMVLACDGLYDIASTNQIGEAIETMCLAGENVAMMAKRLVYSALYHQSKDNVSVMVVSLSPSM